MKEGSSSGFDEEWKQFSAGAEEEILPVYREEAAKKFSEIAEYLRGAPETLPNKEVVTKLMDVLVGGLRKCGKHDERTPERMREELFYNIGGLLREYGWDALPGAELRNLRGSGQILEFQLLRAAQDEAAGKEIDQGDYLPKWLTSREEAQSEIARLRPWSAERATGIPRDERDNILAMARQIYIRFPDLPDARTIEESTPYQPTALDKRFDKTRKIIENSVPDEKPPSGQ